MTVDEKLAKIPVAVDAVFLPGKIHGCEWQAHIIYLDECANNGNGSFEIEIVDRERILKLYNDVNGDTAAFFDKLPDLFHGEWRYCDSDMDGFKDYLDAYPTADFICGRDGTATDEMMFLVNWAKGGRGI